MGAFDITYLRRLLQRHTHVRLTSVLVAILAACFLTWAGVTMVMTESLSLLVSMQPSHMFDRMQLRWNPAVYLNIAFALLVGVLIIRLAKRSNSSVTPEKAASIQVARARAFQQAPAKQSIVLNISELESELHDVVTATPDVIATSTVPSLARSPRRHHHHY